MATVRAQRLLNSLMLGTVNGSQLQTLLATSSNLSDFQQLVNERGKARLLTNNTNSMTAVLNSDTAFLQYANSLTAGTELSSSVVGSDVYYQNLAAIAASQDKMNAVFSNPGIRADTFANTAAAGQLVKSQYMPSQWVKFYNKSSTLPQPISRGFTNVGTPVAAAYGNGVWIVVGGGSTGRVTRSLNNGQTWIDGSGGFSNSGSSNVWRGAAYGNGTFVVVGDGGRIMTSADGAGNWVQRTAAAVGTTNITGVKFANGVFILAANGLHLSTDGITWTQVTTAGATGSIDYGNGRWYAGGGAGAVLTSTDNVNWSSIANFFDASRSTKSVCFSGGTWVITSTTTSTALTVRRSTDGSNFATYWVVNPAGQTTPSAFVTGINGLFFLNTTGTTSGPIARNLISIDGINWLATEAEIGSWFNFTGIVGGTGDNGQAVLIGSDNKIYTMF